MYDHVHELDQKKHKILEPRGSKLSIDLFILYLQELICIEAKD